MTEEIKFSEKQPPVKPGDLIHSWNSIYEVSNIEKNKYNDGLDIRGFQRVDYGNRTIKVYLPRDSKGKKRKQSVVPIHYTYESATPDHIFKYVETLKMSNIFRIPTVGHQDFKFEVNKYFV